MFEHVTLRASDLAASQRFYETVMPTLTDGPWPDLRLVVAEDGRVTRGVHIGFFAPTREHVHRFWEAGTAAGYRDDGEPGPRPQYGPDYYGGFLLDPDGNSAEAVNLDDNRVPGATDHLWIRVADVARAKAFYEQLAPRAGLRLGGDRPERAQFVGEGGTFSVVAGTPTEHLLMGLRASEPATVRDPDGNDVELVG